MDRVYSRSASRGCLDRSAKVIEGRDSFEEGFNGDGRAGTGGGRYDRAGAMLARVMLGQIIIWYAKCWAALSCSPGTLLLLMGGLTSPRAGHGGDILTWPSQS